MEREVVIEPLGSKRFKLELKDANRATLSRSYANASDCCGVKLKQEKFCSGCRKPVEGTPQRKLVKIGKEEHLIEAAALDGAMEQLERMDSIVITSFLKALPEEVEDRFDALIYGLPAEKKSADYKELVELLEGNVAIGHGVFRNNEFQVLLTVGKDGIVRLRKLVEESRRYGISDEAVRKALASEVNGQIIELERQIVAKKAIESFDFSTFKDTRAVIEEKVIEDFVLNGKVPEVRVVEEQQATSEIERLKALLS